MARPASPAGEVVVCYRPIPNCRPLARDPGIYYLHRRSAASFRERQPLNYLDGTVRADPRLAGAAALTPLTRRVPHRNDASTIFCIRRLVAQAIRENSLVEQWDIPALHAE